MQRLRARLDAAVRTIEEFKVNVATMVTAEPAEAQVVADRAVAGTRLSVASPRLRRKVKAILGFDFGTSSAKIVVRLPYEAGAPAFAMPVPPFARAEGHKHLWASRLWISDLGEFSLVPVSGAKILCGIKSGLMRTPRQPLAWLSGGVAVTPVESATAFIALLLQQTRGWAITERKDTFSLGPLDWGYNIGFPAASLDDAGLHEFLRNCRCRGHGRRLA